LRLSPLKAINIFTWLLISLISLVVVFVIHLIIYAVFYSGKVSFFETYSGISIIFYFYAIGLPGSIVHSYKPVHLLVEHEGEVDSMLIKDYFIKLGYVELADGNVFF